LIFEKYHLLVIGELTFLYHFPDFLNNKNRFGKMIIDNKIKIFFLEKNQEYRAKKARNCLLVFWELFHLSSIGRMNAAFNQPII